MSERIGLTYTSHAGLSHTRRAGERTTLCGRYFPASHLTRETANTTLPQCSGCATIAMHDANVRAEPWRPSCPSCGSGMFTQVDEGPLTCLHCQTEYPIESTPDEKAQRER